MPTSIATLSVVGVTGACPGSRAKQNSRNNLMSAFYLRIEGVNLSYVLEDTNQLSVVRGSSLLLRQAVKDIEAKFPALRKISTGASIGLFQFETDGEEEIKGLHDKIVGFLSKDWRYKHFTFVVDIQ